MKSQTLGAIGLLTALLATAIAPGIARADIPGDHPHYLHARSDLRKAEQLLQLPDERNVKAEETIAAREIHAAIREIDRASVLDRKDVDDHPAMVQSAKRDTSLEEDNNSARAWRHRANVHLDQAEHHVDLAIQRDRRDDHR
jgi:hypothetical protein